MTTPRLTRRKQLMAILWPSFVGAGIFSGLLFAFVDPLLFIDALSLQHGHRLAGYSVSFLFLWLLGAIVAYFSITIIATPDPN